MDVSWVGQGIRASQFSPLEWGHKCADRIVFDEFNDAWPRICNPVGNASSFE